MGGMAKKVLWLFFVGSVAIAVWRIFPWENPNEAWTMLGQLSADFGAWIKGVLSGFHLEDIKSGPSIVLPSATPSQ